MKDGKYRSSREVFTGWSVIEEAKKFSSVPFQSVLDFE